MNFIDAIILILIIMSGINGFRKGIINSVVLFAGSLIVFILAFYLKNPVSALLYQNFPFFNLGGKFAGIAVFNILIYEGISYMLTITLLGIIFKVVSKVTGMVSSLINSTLVLGFPSKILGALVGLLQGFIIAFIVVFLLGLNSTTSAKVNESKYGKGLLSKTPVLSSIVGDTYNSIKEVYEIVAREEKNTNKNKANLDSLDTLLKYEILSTTSADKLIETGKLNMPGAKEVVDKYREEV